MSSNPPNPARKLKRHIAPVPWRRLRCVFENDGFTFRRQEGDHLILAKAGCLRPVVIPTYDAIDVDIIKSNMRTARMSRERYFELLDECRGPAQSKALRFSSHCDSIDRRISLCSRE